MRPDEAYSVSVGCSLHKLESTEARLFVNNRKKNHDGWSGRLLLLCMRLVIQYVGVGSVTMFLAFKVVFNIIQITINEPALITINEGS